jgi:deoxyadenosine/deoxycytidine kinase
MFSTFTVADYFFVKTLLFAKNNLNEAEFRLFQRLFTVLNATFPKPDLLLYLHRPVEVLLAQIQRRGRAMETYITPEYLADLQNAYLDYFKTEKETPVVVLDLKAVNYLEDVRAFDRIIELLASPFEPGVHFLNL